MKKRSRRTTTGMKPGRATTRDKRETDRERRRNRERERNQGTYDSIEKGHICRAALCRALHSSASSDLFDATSNPSRGESERNSEVGRERKRSARQRDPKRRKKREKETRFSSPSGSCRSYIVISSYLPADKSVRFLSTRHPLKFTRELTLVLKKENTYRRYIGHIRLYPPREYVK